MQVQLHGNGRNQGLKDSPGWTTGWPYGNCVLSVGQLDLDQIEARQGNRRQTKNNQGWKKAKERMYIYIYIHTLMYSHIHLCVHIYIYIYIYIYRYIYIYVHAYIYICVCVYIYILLFIHYTYDQLRKSGRSQGLKHSPWWTTGSQSRNFHPQPHYAQSTY